MTTAALDGFALRLVDAYRERLSPRKRFHCAAGVAGHSTCSTAIRAAIQDKGLLGAVRPAAAQFATCAGSARQLRDEHIAMMGQGPGFGGPGGQVPGPNGGGFGGPGMPMGGPRRRRSSVQGVFCCGPIPIPFKF